MLNIELDTPERKVPAVNHTVIVLDESGSMRPLHKEALDGLNEQIQTCRAAETSFEKRISIYTFGGDQVRRLSWLAKPEEIDDFKAVEYQPNGNTPLRDAVGRAIEELSTVDTDESTFLLLIITDGMENASKEWSIEKLAEFVQTKQKTGRWTFTVQGANIDLENLVTEWGVPVGNVAEWASTPEGTEEATALRTAQTVSYYAAANQGIGQLKNFYSGEGETSGAQPEVKLRGGSNITKDDILDK